MTQPNRFLVVPTRTKGWKCLQNFYECCLSDFLFRPSPFGSALARHSTNKPSPLLNGSLLWVFSGRCNSPIQQWKIVRGTRGGRLRVSASGLRSAFGKLKLPRFSGPRSTPFPRARGGTLSTDADCRGPVASCVRELQRGEWDQHRERRKGLADVLLAWPSSLHIPSNQLSAERAKMGAVQCSAVIYEPRR